MTIIETAKFNRLDLRAYLADIFGRIHDHKINRIDELLPWNWKPFANQAAAARVAVLIGRLRHYSRAFWKPWTGYHARCRIEE